ncbi:hypothetical protein HK414_26030 [Ramlibacter terrae]|uniref:Uncharacterized protein n=1 Tax=Ramlibacter terrae TaxID=2732511 RepID=A0ABX6P7K0_9BURK|nr:hypothetical protein HK414_26030 [Ramlibacter terrae]
MRTTGWVFCAALALTLAGCGGGGGNPGTCNGSAIVCGGVDGTPPPDNGGATDSAVGLFKGTTGTGRTAYTLVLEGGDFWILYGQPGNADVLGGFERGTYSAADGEISVPNLVDFSAATGLVASGSMTGNYITETSIAGTVQFGAEVVSFAGAYDPDSTEAADGRRGRHLCRHLVRDRRQRCGERDGERVGRRDRHQHGRLHHQRHAAGHRERQRLQRQRQPVRRRVRQRRFDAARRGDPAGHADLQRRAERRAHGRLRLFRRQVARPACVKPA